MAINGGALHSLHINQRDRLWAHFFGAEELKSQLGPGVRFFRDQQISKDQQILNLLRHYRRPDDDDYDFEYEQTENKPDDFITIKVKFDDLIYRFDGILTHSEDKEDIKVLSINTIDDVDIIVTDLHIEINNDYLQSKRRK